MMAVASGPAANPNSEKRQDRRQPPHKTPGSDARHHHAGQLAEKNLFFQATMFRAESDPVGRQVDGRPLPADDHEIIARIKKTA